MSTLISAAVAASLAIVAAGTVERSYQVGLVGELFAAPADACPVVELTRAADAASIADALAQVHDMARRAGCSTIVIVES